MRQYCAFKNISVSLFVVVALSFTASAVLASGTHSDDGKMDMKHDAYHTGKVVYQKKLSCPSCALKDIELTKTSVTSVIDKITNDGDVQKALTSEEREAVLHYLNKRFFKPS